MMNSGKTSYSDAEVKDFLSEHFNKTVSNIESLKGGEWSSAYGFQVDDEDYVVRFGKYGDDFKKDEIAAGFASETLPIPKVYSVGEAFDGSYAISKRAYGVMLDELDKTSMERVVPAIFHMFDAMRGVNLSSTKGFGAWLEPGTAPYASWSDYLLDVNRDDPERRIHGWKASLESSSTGVDLFNKAYERLVELASFSPNEKHLIHSDLLYRNVLVEKNSIAAVIDWGNSMHGDFLYDIAWFSYWSSWYPAMEGVDWEEEARQHFKFLGLEVQNFDERMLACKLHIGLSAQQYNAYTTRWDELAKNAEATLKFAESSI